MNYNLVILAGHLTRDPELRYTPSGMAACQITIGNNRKWKSDSGEPKEEVGFYRCVAFGKTAETISQYFKRGQSIMVQGRLKQETWDDKTTGQKRSEIKIVIASFTFTDRKPDAENAEARSQNSVPAVPESSDAPPQETDDVPF